MYIPEGTHKEGPRSGCLWSGEGEVLSWALSSSTCPMEPTLCHGAQGGCERHAPALGPISPTSWCHPTLVLIFLHSMSHEK